MSDQWCFCLHQGGVTEVAVGSPAVSLPEEKTLFVVWLSLVAAIPSACLYFFRFAPPWPDSGFQLLPSFAESHIGPCYRLPDGSEYPRSDVLNFRFGKTGFRLSNTPAEGVLCGLSATPIPKCYAHGAYVPVVIEFFGRSGSLLAEVEAALSVDRFIEMEKARKRDARRNTEPTMVAIDTPDAPPHRRGRYVFTVASCAFCHNPNGAGGQKICWRPFGTLWSRNITSDVRTGIGAWTDQQIARAIRSGITPDGRTLHWQGMIWDHASNWDEEDIRALVAYLRTLPPVVRQIPAARSPAPDDCAVYTFWIANSTVPGCR